jgi:hypothetical protein
MADEIPTVTLDLWRSDALVLFDWLSEVDLNRVPITHPSQKQALSDLHSSFEWRCDYPVQHATVEEIAEAQSEVARDMGW